MSTTSFANPVAIYLFQILSVAEAPRLSRGVLLAGGAFALRAGAAGAGAWRQRRWDFVVRAGGGVAFRDRVSSPAQVFMCVGMDARKTQLSCSAALPVEPVGVRVSNRGEMAPRAAPRSGQISACVRSSVLPGRIL